MSPDMRVLFVDDAPLDVMFEQHELTRHGISFASQIAASEAELVDALTDFNPDVVLCDHAMPGFSGWNALETLRRLRPLTPIIMVSGSIADDTAIECLGHGAVDYILKSNLRRLGPAVRRAVADTRRREVLEARIDELVHYDMLTGLPNLAHLRPAVLRAFERARGHQTLAALLVLNLDHFRFIDERFGRSSADDVLRDIGAMLKDQSQPVEFVARIGPNEFLVVLCDLMDAQQAAATAARLLAAIETPRVLAGHEVRLGASAGIALYPTDGQQFDSLLCKATDAVKEAKAVSPGTVQFHSGDVVQHARARRQLESGLRDAIQQEELTLHYQPQFDIGSGQACGVEALARWFPTRGATIAPSVFIPLAEQTGLIAALGVWALRTSCATSAGWSVRRLSVPISVNVSPHQISAQFTAQIAAALKCSGLPADQLELEITESVLLAGVDEARYCMAQWKGLGVRIALDDFGIGYSSLSYLARLPIDRLKIDGSLIRGITSGSKTISIVRAVVSLGRELGFTVLAEGVETEEQLRILHNLGCQQAQGFLMSPAVPADDAYGLMRHRWGARTTAPQRRANRQ